MAVELPRTRYRTRRVDAKTAARQWVGLLFVEI